MPLIYDRVGQPCQGTFYPFYITLNCPVSNLLDIKMLDMTAVASLHFISSENIPSVGTSNNCDPQGGP